MTPSAQLLIDNTCQNSYALVPDKALRWLPSKLELFKVLFGLLVVVRRSVKIDVRFVHKWKTFIQWVPLAMSKKIRILGSENFTGASYGALILEIALRS